MKRYILSVLCVLMTLSGVAQNSRVIKGKVLDIDGQSIAGATLRVMGSNEEIRSAEDGLFTFNVSPYAKELEKSLIHRCMGQEADKTHYANPKLPSQDTL